MPLVAAASPDPARPGGAAGAARALLITARHAVIGLKINNYEIKALLGQGGMGAVYQAEHPVLDRRIAVKVLKRELAEDQALVARFVNEAKAAATIRQPNVIEVFDVGVLPDGLPYLMMELLEGETLGRRLDRERRLAVRDAAAIAGQAAAALEAAHALGIVHRDLKPDNLFLVPDPAWPGGARVKVLDFGIAKLKRELSGGSFRTHTGSLMGTPPYMSPEQCRGISAEIDHRSDVYSLGIILHEMLAGAPPFLSEGFGDVLMMHIAEAPKPLRAIDPDIHPAIEAVVLRALEKDRARRFAGMAAFAGALAAAAEGRMPPDGDVAPAAAGGTLRASRPATVRPRAVAHTAGGFERASTTLTSANGQVLAEARAAGRRGRPAAVRQRRALVVSGGALAAVAAAAVLLAQTASRRAGHAPAPAHAITAETAIPAAAPPRPAIEAPPVAPGASAPAPAPPPASPTEEPAPLDPSASASASANPSPAHKNTHVPSATKRRRAAIARALGDAESTRAEAPSPPPPPTHSLSLVPAPTPAPAPSASPPPPPPAAEAAAAASPPKPRIRIEKW